MDLMEFEGELQLSDNNNPIQLTGEIYTKYNQMRNGYKGKIINPLYSNKPEDIWALFLPGKCKVDLIICTLKSIEEIVNQQEINDRNKHASTFIPNEKYFTPTYKLTSYHKKREFNEKELFLGTYKGTCVQLSYLLGATNNCENFLVLPEKKSKPRKVQKGLIYADINSKYSTKNNIILTIK